MTDIPREPIRIGWKLLAELWCVPIDLTPAEKEAMLRRIRCDLGDDFHACPLEFIEDRCYGGIKCNDDPQRRHVYFATAQYSFGAAEEGRFWANDRVSGWRFVREMVGDTIWLNDGPFTADMPEHT